MKFNHSVYRVEKFTCPKQVVVPTSKSYANRLLVLAAITSEPFVLEGVTPSTDVTHMIMCLRKIGLKISVSNDFSKVVVENSFPQCEQETSGGIIELEAGDGGTTNRFLLALLCLGEKKYRLKASGKMAQRPSEEFFFALKQLGVSLISDAPEYWCEVQGPVQSNELTVEVDCSRSTQFATALELALVERKIKVVPLNLHSSIDYWRMTEKLIQNYRDGQRHFVVPVDFSSLTYPLALGFFSGEIRISNCFARDEFQADVRFIDFLEMSGAVISFDSNGLKLSNNLLYNKPLDVSVAACPDLTPSLAFVCSLIKGKSVIRDVDNLRHKESDRVEEILKVLKSMNVTSSFDSVANAIIIDGGWIKNLEGVDLNLPEDHRIIMMSYLFLNAASKGTLNNAAHVEKSFPNFFKVMSGE